MSSVEREIQSLSTSSTAAENPGGKQSFSRSLPHSRICENFNVIAHSSKLVVRKKLFLEMPSTLSSVRYIYMVLLGAAI